jgi:hypothetical protein
MPDIKEQSIVAEVKDAVQGDEEFDHTEVRGEMPTGLLHLSTDRMSHLFGQFGQLIEIEGLEVGWRCDAGQNREVHEGLLTGL